MLCEEGGAAVKEVVGYTSPDLGAVPPRAEPQNNGGPSKKVKFQERGARGKKETRKGKKQRGKGKESKEDAETWGFGGRK